MSGIAIAYLVTALFAAVYASFELRLFLAFLRARPEVRKLRDGVHRGHVGEVPTVTIQIPLYNERGAAAVSIRAAAAQNYPRDRFEIQVLDDSTDETVAIVDALVEELAATGVAITVIRRAERQGYKAGALAHGLTLSQSELVAIFDADFDPPPDFLKNLVLDQAVFTDARVAFVQARWGFHNARDNLLTAAQSLFLERHFFIQKPTWLHLGRVTQFNGSGGIWRRAAIEAAGGWSSDTLTEDLDLSYRVAMAGWRAVYVSSVSAESELPSHLLSFKLQQRRWAKGSAQAVKKLAGRILRARHFQSRMDELFIVAGYVVHPILLLNTLLWPWAVLYATPKDAFLFAQAVLSAATFVGPISFALTAKEMGRPLGIGFLRDVLAASVLGMGLMVNNSVAHMSGYFVKDARFDRTPKGKAKGSYRLPLHWSILLEGLLLVYTAGSAVWLIREGQLAWAPPCIIWTFALSLMLVMQLAPQAITQRAKGIS
jgi:cellulose synthase/poly-beta-1,6-N-acetylglucosamine synthase-like glycosyltransferase